MTDSKSYHELSQQYSNKINPEIANDLLYRKGGVEYWVKLLTENFVIKDKEGKVRLMSPLKLPQLKLLKLWQYMVEEEWPIRLICLKSRKTGVSSLSQALCLLRSMGYDAWGIDPAPRAIEYCEKRRLTTCVTGSAVTIPFEDNSFHIIFSTDTIEHIRPREVDKVIDEFIE